MIKALIEKHGDIMIEELPIDYTKLIHDLCMFGIRGNPDHDFFDDMLEFAIFQECAKDDVDDDDNDFNFDDDEEDW